MLLVCKYCGGEKQDYYSPLAQKKEVTCGFCAQYEPKNLVSEAEQGNQSQGLRVPSAANVYPLSKLPFKNFSQGGGI